MIKKISAIILLLVGMSIAQSVEDCMDCHSDEEMTGFVNDGTTFGFNTKVILNLRIKKGTY